MNLSMSMKFYIRNLRWGATSLECPKHMIEMHRNTIRKSFHRGVLENPPLMNCHVGTVGFAESSGGQSTKSVGSSKP